MATRKTTKAKQKAKPKAKAKAKAKSKSPVHMGKALLRSGSMSDRMKENILKSDKAEAKKYGVTLEEYRRAMKRK